MWVLELILVPLTMYFVLNEASLVPEICACAFSSRLHFPVESWIVYFWENCGDDIQVNDFSIAGDSDALNPCPPWQCCAENRYTPFHGKNNCWHASSLAVFIQS